MMYSNQFAAAIMAAGKVLREFDKDTVYLPFGAEYEIRLKNLNTVRAVANVTIDGKDVGDGHGFVVQPNSKFDIKRFIRNGNLNEGNRFKFIECTSAVEQHRGTDVEDGLIRIEFQFERLRPQYDIKPLLSRTGRNYDFDLQHGNEQMKSFGMDSFTSSTANEVGVTAPGSIVDQQFSLSDDFPLEAMKHSMVIRLLGETEDNQQVVQPVTVKHTKRCVSCGYVNRAQAKFCVECGTSLRII